ncbi:MAG: hypothetical protein JFR41_08055 [Muribaculaceae bacterium]|nr:hypothetical protein [Muribaculaceae bacterium]
MEKIYAILPFLTAILEWCKRLFKSDSVESTLFKISTPKGLKIEYSHRRGTTDREAAGRR